eukprot:CAMPEP_0167801220 /NCGR_PEP_ID=MMETSP0111_2-20121227/18275_1 /TAXON_ID=91324 /ORGANISM="Lotharella globosa, Strain CCCM811" /LENGTH=206 /DNA_ID=CAMNT_0007696785 /DNA_START=119 /DNA_END=736 /DNA_ORIENTATION=-
MTEISEGAGMIVSSWCSMLTDEDKAALRCSRVKKKITSKTKKRKRESARAPPASQKVRRRDGSAEVLRSTRSRLSAVDALTTLSSDASSSSWADSHALVQCPLCWQSKRTYRGQQGLRAHLTESKVHANLRVSEVRDALTRGMRAETTTSPCKPDPHSISFTSEKELSPILDAARRGDALRVKALLGEQSPLDVKSTRARDLLNWA